MITSIQGLLASATPLHVIIELNGFGYEVNIPVTTAEKLPAPGVIVKLHTQVIYREDAQTLYGFATTTDRDFFRLMIEHVTGIGPKSALVIMSRLSVDLLESAIRSGDVGMLAKCPGIGKKTAERLVVELKSKVSAGPATTGNSPSDIKTGSPAPSSGVSAHRDAIAALVALGYKAPDADTAIRQAALALGSSASTEVLIKKALN
ncbi:MAG: Holliday junction branch migration protein RuvA [Undibacterium sp.]|nr:Holliday junction branch migration protein RuvA [Opitutaceae bacterium]